MKEISKKDEQRIIEALETAVKEANKGTEPDEALMKVATDYQFQPEIVKRMVAAYNTSKTLAHLKNAKDEEKADSFPLASAENILSKLFPQEPQTPAKEASAMLSPEYYSDDGVDLRGFDKAANRIRDLPALTEKKAEAYEHEDFYAAKKALQNHEKLAGLAKRADDAFRTIYFKFLEELDKAASYWRGVGPKESFELVEKRAVAQFGDPAKTIMTMIYGHGNLDDGRLHVKRADDEDLGSQQMHFDPYREPYDKISGLMFLTDEMNRIRKEAAEIRSVMDDHAVSNIDLLPPQPVCAAIERFLKSSAKKETGRNKSFLDKAYGAKAKEVYRKLKKTHPEYSAGKKARIANAVENEAQMGKGDQPGGVDYGKTTSSHVLDDLFVKE